MRGGPMYKIHDNRRRKSDDNGPRVCVVHNMDRMGLAYYFYKGSPG